MINIDHQKLFWGAGTIVRFIIRVRNKAKASAQVVLKIRQNIYLLIHYNTLSSLKEK